MPSEEATREELLKELAAARKRIAELEASNAERTRREQALQAAYALASAALETTPNAVFVKDLEGRYLLANAAVARIVGEPKDRIIGRDDNELVLPEIARSLRAIDQEVMASGETRTIAETVISEGEEHTWLTTKSPYRDQQGNIIGVVGIGRDITESQQADKALRESEERLRLALAGGDLGFWDFYPQTGEAFFDERWLRMLGYGPGEVEPHARGWEALINPDDKARVQELLNRHFEDPSVVYEVEMRLRTKAGPYKSILARGEVLLRDEEGRPLRMTGTHFDITERSRAQDQATRFYSVLEGSRHEIYLFDAETLYFVEVNRGARENLGYSLEALKQLTPVDLKPGFTPESFARVLEPLRSGLRKTIKFETVHCRKDGSEYPVEVGVELASGTGSVFVAIVRDLTERKELEKEHHRLEAQFQSAQKLEGLGVLAGGLAHDFNNLLLGIHGNMELALLDIEEGSPARAYLARAKTASRRAADLVLQMLAYAGEGSTSVQEADLNPLVQEMVDLLRASISKKTTIRFNAGEDLLPLRGDPTQIHQVVMNLVTNAAQAIGDEVGLIALTTERVECDRASLNELRPDEDLLEGTYLSLRVSDSGCGMDDATRERIFDPFFTTKPTGTGLGLSAVHGIIRGHGGALRIESEPGKGSSFTILLPAVLRAAEAPEPDQPAGEWRGKGTILIVDDEDLIREFAAGALNLLGFSVLRASNGVEAVELFRERSQEIDCVLLDFKMPQMGGKEAFAEFRRIQPDARVILCSGLLEQESTEQLKSQGLAAFIQKPYSIDELRETLRKTLGDNES